MVTASENVQLEDASSSSNLVAWQDFGFHKTENERHDMIIIIIMT